MSAIDTHARCGWRNHVPGARRRPTSSSRDDLPELSSSGHGALAVGPVRCVNEPVDRIPLHGAVCPATGVRSALGISLGLRGTCARADSITEASNSQPRNAVALAAGSINLPLIGSLSVRSSITSGTVSMRFA